MSKVAAFLSRQPAQARLAHGSDEGAPFMSTRLNLFTAMAIVGILVLVALILHLRAQVGSVETKLMLMLATAS